MRNRLIINILISIVLLYTLVVISTGLYNPKEWVYPATPFFIISTVIISIIINVVDFYDLNKNKNK